jgi:hypothetical protein
MNDNEAESHKAGLLRYIHHLQTDYQGQPPPYLLPPEISRQEIESWSWYIQRCTQTPPSQWCTILHPPRSKPYAWSTAPDQPSSEVRPPSFFLENAHWIGYNAISAKGKEKALDWNIPETYLDIIKEEVTIAVTEDGLADSVQTLEGGEEVFVKPLNEEMALSDFFDRLSELSLHLEYLYWVDLNFTDGWW